MTLRQEVTDAAGIVSAVHTKYRTGDNAFLNKADVPEAKRMIITLARRKGIKTSYIYKLLRI